jgi:hypothetical protein
VASSSATGLPLFNIISGPAAFLGVPSSAAVGVPSLSQGWSLTGISSGSTVGPVGVYFPLPSAPWGATSVDLDAGARSIAVVSGSPTACEVYG